MSVRVIAAVIERGGRLLVCQRPEHKRHSGLWEFPGGKLEPNEDDVTAARRELRDEPILELVAAGQPSSKCAISRRRS
ncbi:MAG: NUDIX domain-containing protein [Gemmatimonadaceae bacterium]